MRRIILKQFVYHTLGYHETCLQEAISCESNTTHWLERFKWKYPPQRTIRESLWPPGFEPEIYESEWNALMALVTLLRFEINVLRTEIKANRMIINSEIASYSEIKKRNKKLRQLSKGINGIIKEIDELIASDAGL